MASLPIYLRLKHTNQTVFMTCEPGDTVALLKSRVQDINRVPVDRIRILAGDQVTVLEDESTVADHQLKDNSVLYFVYKTDGDMFEVVDIPKYAGVEEEVATEGDATTVGGEGKK
mmetsp:Transcript_20740/g.58665  ORF Transcript_20740/g.58665 Transcript_20740/m.58665 type:complete len:115 (+) Transcript_20740:97-441(+)